MKKHTLFTHFLLLFVLIFSVSCSKEKENGEDIAFFRDKIINQRLMLDDALKQLEYEKTQVDLLKKQVEINQQTNEQNASNHKETVILASNKIEKSNEKLAENLANAEDYERLKAEVSLWQSRASKKEEKYLQAKQQLQDVLELLSKNKIEQVKDKFGKLEKIIMPIVASTQSPTNSEDRSNNKVRNMYDSLVILLASERNLTQNKVANLERMLAYSNREINRWKSKFNRSGTYFGEDIHSNFVVNLSADSSNTNKILFTVVISRDANKLKKMELPVKIACKLPNGNLVNTYSGKIEYEKNAPHATVKNLQSFAVETAGWHEVIVYLNNKEVYYEDIFFSKK
jgi:hypothetical protein